MLMQINDVTNENGRTLDLCFVSDRDIAPKICPAPAALVKTVLHHPQLHLIFENKKTEEFDDTCLPVRYDYSNADFESILSVLFNWDSILDNLYLYLVIW